MEFSKHIVDEWHPTKNNGFSITDFSYGSGKKVWWLGSCGHEWEMAIRNRTTRNQGCNICAGKIILRGFNDLGTSNPELSLQWNNERNVDLTPYDVPPGSSRKVWWECKIGHEWEASISHRSNGQNCPFCASRNALKGFNDLATSNPELLKEWHPSKNGDIQPFEVTTHSNKRIWWQCEIGHEWEAVVASRVRGRACPVCIGKIVKTGFNDLTTKSPKLVSEWHPTKNIGLLPTELTIGSDKVIWWVCSKGHEWQAMVKNRIHGTGCSVCASKSIVVGVNDLSAEYPKIASEWHPTKNVNLLPIQVSPGSGKKAWWLCSSGHEWEAPIYRRTAPKTPTGCPICAIARKVSLAEQQLVNFLTPLVPMVQQSNRAILNGKEIDLLVKSHNFGMEFNGIYWHTESRGKYKNYHKEKWEQCKTKGISLFQVWEDDWRINPLVAKNYIRHKLNIEPLMPLTEQKIKFELIDNSELKAFIIANKVPIIEKESHYFLYINRSTLKPIAIFPVDLGMDKFVFQQPIFLEHCSFKAAIKYLLKYIKRNYQVKQIIFIDNNCMSLKEIYTQEGFFKADEIDPSLSYVVKNRRKRKMELSQAELSNIDKYQKIWDAGKTIMVKDD